MTRIGYTFGIIGFGNMGRAMAERMGHIKFNFTKTLMFVYDKDPEKTKDARGISVASTARELVGNVNTIILAVKPQDFDSILSEIKDLVKGKLIISIAAGITTGYIERALGDVEVVRAMPNLPAKIGQGITGLCKGRFAESIFEFAQDLFYSLGNILVVEEDMMNAVTAVSGSGPAYVCQFLKTECIDPHKIPRDKKRIFLSEFQNAAQSVGFNKRDAALLVSAVFSGTIAYLKKNKISPAELIQQVASKGGTTEAALKVWEAGGTLEEAVKAALKRAEELSRKE